MAGREFSVQPQLGAVDIELFAPGFQGMLAELRVHHGRVQFIDGTELEAGMRVVLPLERDTALFPDLLTDAGVVAAAGQFTHVFGSQENSTIMLAPDIDRHKSVVDVNARRYRYKLSYAVDYPNQIFETPGGALFPVSGLEPGRYRFHVQPQDAPHQVPQGILQIDALMPQSLAAATRVTVDDSHRVRQITCGTQSPPLEFTWHRVKGAHDYSLMLYAQRDLATPAHVRKSYIPSTAIAAGVLSEGIYYWTVVSRHRDGRELAVSPMYRLSLLCSTVPSRVQLITPQRDAVVTSPVLVQGLVPSGWQVLCNGQQTQVATDGNFSALLNMPPGPGVLYLRAASGKMSDGSTWMVLPVVVAPSLDSSGASN